VVGAAPSMRRMPRISVVVPIYDVESYLATCLQSLARQTERDLEVIMVDDGSTDGSRALAERFACQDRRFHLLTQPNGGLGKARNTGLDLASGEFLAFVDSDDVLPHDAYARLLGALDATGSDLATGNVQRLTRQGTSQAQFLARTFARTRMKTHVSRCRPLLADRTAWNKLWRRSFWDAHGFRFPEGVVHEDIPVTLPAHHLAASVDVIAAPVYQWRVREDGALSITQRRLELRVLHDRLAAIESVRAHLAAHATRKLCLWYDASIVADDLRLHLNLLDEADDEYRALFMTRVTAMLGGAPDRVFHALPAIDRLKWHLVRRGLVDELVEVLRFQKHEAAATPPVRVGRRYYGDYPFRADPRLRIPRSAYRLGRRDEDLALTAHLESVRRVDGKLRIRGHAYVNGLGCASGSGQRTTITALRPGRLRAVRLRLAGVRIPTAPVRRGDLAGGYAWAGFEAALDPRTLRKPKRGQTLFRFGDSWHLYATTRVGLLRRRRARFVLASPELIGALDLDGGDDDVRLRALVTSDGALQIDVRTAWARLATRRVTDGVLELTGELRGGAAPGLEVRRRSDGRVHAYDAAVAGRGFRARLPLADLPGAPPSLEAAVTGGPAAHEMWELTVAGLPVALPEELDGIAWSVGEHEVGLERTRRGEAALLTRKVVTPIVLPPLEAQPAATPA
jgi:CDP-glycerol glycerophosphotransferase